MKKILSDYIDNMSTILQKTDQAAIGKLADALHSAWVDGRQVFMCGNGGSAANAVHMVNDFFYGINRIHGLGMKAHALSANQSITTCLANDEGYEHIYSKQLAVYADKGDILVVLSGSGNSSNILNAIKQGNEMGMHTFAILGFDGGKAKGMVQVPIHFPVNDMQIAEDLQTITLHSVMQYLCANVPENRTIKAAS